MIVHNCNVFPNKDYPYLILTELDEFDLGLLQTLELDEIWYWYGTGSYEGAGQMLMRKGDRYDMCDIGHCSCYGPTERTVFVGHSIDKLISKCSSDLLVEIQPLIEMALA